jgi:hypothetical protein
MSLLASQHLFHLRATLRAKDMNSAQSSTALRTGKPYAGFEVLDINRTSLKVYVIGLHSQGLADAAAEVKEQANQKPVLQISGILLQPGYFLRFEVGFGVHARL